MPDRFIVSPAECQACNLTYEIKECKNDSACEISLWSTAINVKFWPRNTVQLAPGSFLLETVDASLGPFDEAKRFYIRITLKKNSWGSSIPDIDGDIISDWFLLDNNKLKEIWNSSTAQ